jgi:tetratricopeptide (TPR) repeat protein
MNQQESTVNSKALAEFFSIVRPYKENVESIFRRACYFKENRKYRLAIQEFLVVVSMDPNHVQAYNSMGICCDLLGDYERAVYCYKKALAVNPDLAHVLNNLGYSYFLQGKLDSAIQAYKNAIELDAQEPIYHNNLGLAYAEKGLFRPAFEEFALSGGESKAHFNLAQIYFRKHLDAEAEMHLAQAQSAVTPLPSSDSFHPNLTAPTEPYRHVSGGRLSDFASSGSRGAIKGEPEIEVSNGNGVRFMARDVSRYLAKRGFKVQRLTNAETFSHEKTIISFRNGYLGHAYRIARELPGWKELLKMQEIENPNIKIRLILGKDLVLFREIFTSV